MITIQFKAKIEKGIIRVPKKYQTQFNKDVYVILKVENQKSKSENYVDKLITQPFKVKNFHPIMRAHIYAKT